MGSIDKDLDVLEDAILQLKHALFRSRSWDRLIARAGVQLDRPGATILHTISQCSKDKVDCSVQLIAHHLGIEAPSVSRKVQELEQDGLLTRKTNPQDRRTVVLQLSDKGRSVLARIHRAKQEAMATLLEGWSSTDRSQLVTLLHRLAREMNTD